MSIPPSAPSHPTPAPSQPRVLSVFLFLKSQLRYVLSCVSQNSALCMLVQLYTYCRPSRFDFYKRTASKLCNGSWSQPPSIFSLDLNSLVISVKWESWPGCGHDSMYTTLRQNMLNEAQLFQSARENASSISNCFWSFAAVPQEGLGGLPPGLT